MKNGGETGIRTQERVAPLPVFKTGASTTQPIRSQILIVGGGSSGGVLAVLLSELGFEVALVDTRDPELPFLPDSRAFAIVRGGWRVLDAAGVGQRLVNQAEPLLSMEAHDANGMLPPASSMFGVEDLPAGPMKTSL